MNILLYLLKSRTWVGALLSFVIEVLLGHTHVFLYTLGGGFHITVHAIWMEIMWPTKLLTFSTGSLQKNVAIPVPAGGKLQRN